MFTSFFKRLSCLEAALQGRWAGRDDGVKTAKHTGEDCEGAIRMI